jgi:TnpA family transposase
VHTTFLLTFISDVKLREVIHRSTNKAEEYHNFEDWITFASRGIIRERAYAEQEKRILGLPLIISRQRHITLVCHAQSPHPKQPKRHAHTVQQQNQSHYREQR